MAKKLLEELRTFCETTSVRGIPRLFRARSKFTLVVWLLAVLACSGMLAWQLSVIATRYLQYPVSMLTLQAPYQLTPTFPDVTVCNLSPLIYENEFSVDYVNFLIDFYSYSNELREQLTNNLSTITIPSEADVEITVSPEFFSFVSLPTTYLNGFEMKSFTFSEKSSLILSCSFYDWAGRVYNTSCLATIRSIWDPVYYRCFTLSFNDSDRANIRGLSMVAYVDEYLGNQFIRFDLNPSISRSSGVRLLAHASGTAPDMTLGMNVGPGTETTVLLSQTMRLRLADPYSNCTDRKYLSASRDEKGGAYTQAYCVNTCVQQQMVDQCGCVSVSIPQYTMPQLRQTNFSVCGNQSSPRIYDTYVCQKNFVANIGACNAACCQPCSELWYAAKPSSAPWPQVSNQLAFYSTYIAGNERFGSKFDAIKFAAANAYFNNETTKAYVEKLKASGLIKNSFLQLNVQFGSPTFIIDEDVPGFSVDAMGAQIGGVLSLWLGVTVMFAFEVLEFLFACLTGWHGDARGSLAEEQTNKA